MIKGLEKELSLIKNKDVRMFTTFIVDNFPDYFEKIGASSSGKYHPKSDIGEGGLLRHTKNVVKVAHELFIIHDFTEYEQDIIIASLIVHDGFKHGDNLNYDETGNHSWFEHPLVIRNYIRHPIELNDVGVNFLESKYDDIRSKMLMCVASHMGQWNTNKYSDEILPLPKTDMEKYVHLCDYIASRKCINVDLED